METVILAAPHLPAYIMMFRALPSVWSLQSSMLYFWKDSLSRPWEVGQWLHRRGQQSFSNTVMLRQVDQQLMDSVSEDLFRNDLIVLGTLGSPEGWRSVVFKIFIRIF